MSNYNKATNFAVKDTLSSGDPDKIVSGAEIDNEFNAISSAVNSKADSSELQALAPVPSGGIIMWSGAIISIPSGWALCNGANGTPDLREKFIVGAGGTYDVGDTGGADSVQLTENEMPSHDHSASTSGSHNHNGSTSTANLSGSFEIVQRRTSNGLFDVARNESGVFSFGGITDLSADGADSESDTGCRIINFNADHNHSISSDGNHTHSISNTGGDQSHENRPPYYALAYIMKL